MIDNQPNNCVTLHLRSAFPLEDLETSAIQESPAGQALPCITRRQNPQRHETSRLVREASPTNRQPKRSIGVTVFKEVHSCRRRGSQSCVLTATDFTCLSAQVAPWYFRPAVRARLAIWGGTPPRWARALGSPPRARRRRTPGARSLRCRRLVPPRLGRVHDRGLDEMRRAHGHSRLRRVP